MVHRFTFMFLPLIMLTACGGSMTARPEAPLQSSEQAARAMLYQAHELRRDERQSPRTRADMLEIVQLFNELSSRKGGGFTLRLPNKDDREGMHWMGIKCPCPEYVLTGTGGRSWQVIWTSYATLNRLNRQDTLE